MTGEADPVPYLQRALELDPNFAAAYALLGAAYENRGSPLWHWLTTRRPTNCATA